MYNNYKNVGCNVYQYQVYIVQHHATYAFKSNKLYSVHFTSVVILDIPSSLTLHCTIAALFTLSLP